MNKTYNKLNILFKIHFNYLFQKSFLIIMGFVFVAILLLNIIEAQNYKNTGINSYIYYLESQKTYLLIIFSFFCPFVFSNSFLKKNDNYCLMLITYNTNRSIYFITKLLLLITLCIIIYLICLCEVVIIGIINFETFMFSQIILQNYIIQLIPIIYYSIITLAIVLKYDVIYSVFLGFVLSVVSTNIRGNINLVMINSEYALSNTIYTLLVIILEIILIIIYYTNKDL